MAFTQTQKWERVILPQISRYNSTLKSAQRNGQTLGIKELDIYQQIQKKTCPHLKKKKKKNENSTQDIVVEEINT